MVWNSVTFQNSSGGVVAVYVEDNARELETRVGNDLYPSSVEAIDASCVITVDLQEFDPTALTVGASSNLVVTIVNVGGTTTDETYYTMKYMGASHTQGRAAAGSTKLRFVFQSADGAKGPRTT